MKILSLLFLGLAVSGWLAIGPGLHASSPHDWSVSSPDHGQTFAFGSEKNRAWMARGRDRHLALALNFTNDPYVDVDNPRRYDNFIFNFPQVTQGKDGHTFYYRAAEGRPVPVAVRQPGFLGFEQVRLLPNAFLMIDQPHGYLSLSLLLRDAPFTASSD
jgi:hypothetical protein